MPHTNTEEYTIQQTDDRPLTFTLKRGEKTVGILLILNRHGSRARLIAGGQTLLVTRKKGLRKDLHLHEHGHEHETPHGHFVADLFSRGTLSLDGTTYRWIPANKRWTAWAWHDAHGEILRIQEALGLLSVKGKVNLAHAKDASSGELLALLGWYLLHLGQMNTLAHLFTSFEVCRTRQKTLSRTQ